MLQQGGSKLPGGQLHHRAPTSTHHGPAHMKPLSDHHCKLGMSRLQMFSQAFVSWRRDFPSLNIDTTMQISPSYTTPPSPALHKATGAVTQHIPPSAPRPACKGGTTQAAPAQHHEVLWHIHWAHMSLVPGESEHSTEHCWTLHYRCTTLLKGVKNNLHHQAAGAHLHTCFGSILPDPKCSPKRMHSREKVGLELLLSHPHLVRDAANNTSLHSSNCSFSPKFSKFKT